VYDRSAVVDNGVSISSNLRSVSVVHNPLLALLLIIGASIVRTVVDEWKLLTVLAHLWWTLAGELELHFLGFVVGVLVWVFSFCWLC
jgi:hypothetical protein